MGTIPSAAHFVWIGHQLPFVYGLALRTAALRGGLQRVVLHHTDDIERPSWWDDVFGLPTVELKRIDPDRLLGSLGAEYAPLVPGYHALNYRANQADLLRTAILMTEGGIYLDTDVIVVASLAPLLEVPMFLGTCRTVWDHRSVETKNPARRMWLRLKSALRRPLAGLKNGHYLYRRLEGLYPINVNIAVWGSAPGHPLLEQTLSTMAKALVDRGMAGPSATPGQAGQNEATMPATDDYNFIGPYLVQRLFESYEGEDIAVHPPDVFCPLPPVVAGRWFGPTPRPNLSAVVTDETRVVHWFASNETKTQTSRITPSFIRDHADRQLFSALALPFVEGMA
ncbi:MAG: glycosyltransferase [Myxococcota bacterium]